MSEMFHFDLTSEEAARAMLLENAGASRRLFFEVFLIECVFFFFFSIHFFFLGVFAAVRKYFY